MPDVPPHKLGQIELSTACLANFERVKEWMLHV